MSLISLDIHTRRPLNDGAPFGEVGPYVQLDGRAHFAVDPGHPANTAITDIGLAPPMNRGGWPSPQTSASSSRPTPNRATAACCTR